MSLVALASLAAYGYWAPIKWLAVALPPLAIVAVLLASWDPAPDDFGQAIGQPLLLVFLPIALAAPTAAGGLVSHMRRR